ncbi:MAG: hypothetical protein NXI10_08205 [bacterium]|nr:hypothetical protein [bacterium]
MRALVLIFSCFVVLHSSAQVTRQPVWTHHQPAYDFEVNDYVYNHFEIVGGGHVFIILPGAHAKLRYAPINYQRIKFIAELRGEVVTAPIAGWNYNFKVATSFDNGVGIHAGLGRSHYVWRMRDYPNGYEVENIYQNSAELGVRWETYRRQWEIWASIPLYQNEPVPIFSVGFSVTAGGLWDFKEQKWFLPKRK